MTSSTVILPREASQMSSMIAISAPPLPLSAPTSPTPARSTSLVSSTSSGCMTASRPSEWIVSVSSKRATASASTVLAPSVVSAGSRGIWVRHQASVSAATARTARGVPSIARGIRYATTG